MSGGFDKTVAIWDVGEGYLKHSLKVPMPASDRASELCSLVIPCGVVDAGGTADLDVTVELIPLWGRISKSLTA